eukprot:6588655-Pyramimonas_sp.AAC.1
MGPSGGALEPFLELSRGGPARPRSGREEAPQNSPRGFQEAPYEGSQEDPRPHQTKAKGSWYDVVGGPFGPSWGIVLGNLELSRGCLKSPRAALGARGGLQLGPNSVP